MLTSLFFFLILLIKEGRKHRASMLLYEDPTYLLRIETRKVAVLVRMPSCVNLLPVAVVVRPI